MSLTGNLEDLPLLDILQIVSFSKKTGYLSIRAAAGEGAIVFREGNVVASFTWDTLPVDPRAATLAPEKRALLLRDRIEMALEQLIRLREGQFSFSLTDATPKLIGTRDITAETLEPGINPQGLLLDLARGMDEDRRDSSAALEAGFTEPPEEPAPEPALEEPAPGLAPEEVVEHVVEQTPPPTPEHTVPMPALRESHAAPATPPPEAAPAAGEEIRAILLVDDEEDVRRILAQQFTQGGYQVLEADDPDSAVKKANRLAKAGIDFILVADLGMPTSGGSSFQGGFEIVKRLLKMQLKPPVLMMSESHSAPLRARAKQMGIASLVFKPGLSKLDPEQHAADLKAFSRKLLADVLPKMASAAAPRARPAPAAAARPPAAASEEAARRPASARDVSRDIQLLHKRLDELRRSGDPTQISAMVMEVAREFFERGILFLVKNDEVKGLGGFGLAGKGENINLVVRDFAVPLAEPSLFLDVVASLKAFAGALPDGKWSRYLMGRIGRFRSGSVALFPLIAHRETIALLFGDNPETGRDLGRLEALEVFMNQAGIALENALLQRKMRAMQERST